MLGTCAMLFDVKCIFMHLTDAFIQIDLHCIQAIHFFCQSMCSLGIKPTTFALLTQCPTTEPQVHRKIVCSDSIWKVGRAFGCCEQILEYLSKLNKTTFASDMFRVFLFSSHKKLNWLLNFLCSGYFFPLDSRTFRKVDFFTVIKCRLDELKYFFFKIIKK